MHSMWYVFIRHILALPERNTLLQIKVRAISDNRFSTYITGKNEGEVCVMEALTNYSYVSASLFLSTL